MSNQPNEIDDLLKLTVQHQKLEGLLTISLPDNVDPINESSLLAYLDGLDVHPQAIDKDTLRNLLTQIKEHPGQPVQACVARGVGPVHGCDAQINLDPAIQHKLDRILARETAFEDASANGILQNNAEDGNAIDFYTLSPFLIVHEGDPICTVTPESSGKDGWDIYGESIASVDGRDNTNIKDPSLRVGDTRATAAISGHLIIQSNSIHISPLLEVPCDVDFSTANIDFPGDVKVGGGVLDRFTVKARGSIEIYKLVQASEIESAQSIILHQGMAGKNTGRLAATKDLTAGYLESVQASVGGNCSIQHEITNCRLRVAGELLAQSAHARGGEISAALGACLGVVGSMQGVVTTIVLGEYAEIVHLIRKTQDYIDQVERAVTAQQNKLDRLTQAIGKPTTAQADELMRMKHGLSELHRKIETLEAANQRLLTNAANRTDSRLTVNECIFAKSVIWMPGYKAVFRRDIRGPITITLSSRGVPIAETAGETRPLGEIAMVYPDGRIPRIEQDEERYRLAA